MHSESDTAVAPARQAPAATKTQAPIAYLLHLADNAVVLGQRNAEWCGHAPILEEDLAMANNSLDLIGQARLLYQYAAERMAGDVRAPRGAAWPAGSITEDTLAYFRGDADFRNYVLLELPHTAGLVPAAGGERDWAVSLVRNFFYSALMVGVWERLQHSADAHLAAIAAKSLKEVRYHLRHSRDWLVRMGDGTAESHERAQRALNHFMPFVQEFWTHSDMEAAAAAAGVGFDVRALQGDFDTMLNEALAEATLQRPAAGGYVTTGKHGVHSEHLDFVLSEMQSLARAHPEAVW